MGRCVVLAALSLLGTCRAGDAELGSMLVELKQLAQIQQERIAAYEALAEKQQAEASSRQLQAAQPRMKGRLTETRSYSPIESDQMLMTHVWLLLCGALAMFMQAGFAMIETGAGRVKNAQIILLKNLTVVAASCLGWWSCGWSLAYSGPYSNGYKANKFAGYEQFFGRNFMIDRQDGSVDPSTDLLHWFLSWAFCSAATVIASAGVLERINFLGSLIFALLFSGGIYPMVVASTWGRGWLADMNSVGYMDFAGSGIVFMSGGVASLMGTLIAGRRIGRFDELSAKKRLTEWPKSFQPHSLPLVVMGTFIVWFGWYGIVCGAIQSMKDNEKAMLAAQVAMNTTIAAAGGGLTTFLLRTAQSRKLDIAMFCNGILAGLVSISAGCSTVEYGPAVAIGCVGGIFYFATSLVMKIAKIDDPVDAFAVYGVPGMWGVLGAAIFDWGNSFDQVHGWQGFRCIRDAMGNCKSGGLGKDLLAANGSLIGAVFGWVAIVSAIVFLVLKVTKLLKNQQYVVDDRGEDEGIKIDYKFEDVAANSSI